MYRRLSSRILLSTGNGFSAFELVWTVCYVTFVAQSNMLLISHCSSDLYCPEGSVQPIFVPAGYYTTGSDSELTRFGIEICPPGMYCQDGRQYECPKGRYSDEEGTVDPNCKGECDAGGSYYHGAISLRLYVDKTAGYYCLAGSSTPRQFECGNATVYCPRGSSEPRSVHNGFYCDLTGDSKGSDRYWSKGLTVLLFGANVIV